jgi:hypothetical protein
MDHNKCRFEFRRNGPLQIDTRRSPTWHNAQLLAVITEAAMADPKVRICAEQGSRGPSHQLKYRSELGPIKVQQFSGSITPCIYLCHRVALLLTFNANDRHIVTN